MESWDILDKNGNKTGKTIERGKPLHDDEYHLVVHVWIRNSKREYLISKRTPNKTYPNMWDTVGGSAIAGETSIDAAVREVYEEIGLMLRTDEGKLIKRLMRQQYNSPDFVDVWFFNKDIEISQLKFQPDEVSDAKWADKETLLKMIHNGEMVDVYSYLYEVFCYNI